MLNCPNCGSYSRTRVRDSRPIEQGNCIRRRRGCDACGKRWTTYERNSDSFSTVWFDREEQLEPTQ